MMKFNKTSQDYKKLNDFIRGEMRRQKVSQASIAYSLNLSQQGISERLSGNTEWTMWEVINVFEILGVNFNYKKDESCTGATERKRDD